MVCKEDGGGFLTGDLPCSLSAHSFLTKEVANLGYSGAPPTDGPRPGDHTALLPAITLFNPSTALPLRPDSGSQALADHQDPFKC